MNSKGDQNSFLIYAFIAIAVFIIGAIFLIHSGLLLGGDYDLRACQLSLVVQANTKVAGVVSSPFSVDCPRRFLTITDTSTMAQNQGSKVPATPVIVYTPDTKDQTKLVPGVTYSKLDDNALNSVLAESMRRCWVMALEGKQPIFNAPRTFSMHTVCMICDQIDFKASTAELSGSGASLSNYLTNTKMPNKSPAMTYSQYLFTPTDLQGTYYTTGSGNNQASGFTLSVGKDCLVEKDIEENPDFSTGTYATILFRWFAGNDKGCMATYVVPAAKLRSLCEYKAN